MRQIEDVLKKDQKVERRCTINRRKRMKTLMKMDEPKEICQDRKWNDVNKTGKSVIVGMYVLSSILLQELYLLHSFIMYF